MPLPETFAGRNLNDPYTRKPMQNAIVGVLSGQNLAQLNPILWGVAALCVFNSDQYTGISTTGGRDIV
jgi:hypothetical protein